MIDIPDINQGSIPAASSQRHLSPSRKQHYKNQDRTGNAPSSQKSAY